MHHRSARVPVIAGLALLFALECVCASASAHSKTEPPRKRPHPARAPAVHLIKCAVVFDGSPCWPDPGMVRPERRRLHVDPPLEQRPEFGPAR